MVGGQFKTQTLISAFELARRIAKVKKPTDLKGGVRAGRRQRARQTRDV